MGELALDRDQYLELEKLALGAFRPLSGFMSEDELHGVVEGMRLPCGALFPLPVVLDVSEDEARRLRGRPSVALTHGGEAVGTLHPSDVYRCDKPAVCRAVFGTDDAAHPGVANFLAGGDWFLGGAVELACRATFDVSAHELTPAEARATFAERGWRTVVGFQTRNVPHRAHEYLLRVALEIADGLFVQPLLGRRKAGDYTPEAIIAGYNALIGEYMHGNRLVLGVLTTAMRYAGPREAIFHAIVRRNYGCTHFIVGRDHAGVGDYYGKYQAHALVETVADELGIEILCLCGPFHCRHCDGIVTEKTCPHLDTDPNAVTEISGTNMRAMLVGGREPDPHLMRPEVIAALRDVPLFIEEDGP
jgi:sulfate adenylyltransferase